jgi:CDP-glucose 4,6-dehydratase
MAHYLITGHTGFKGAWLTLLLKARGHEVSGLALTPLPGSLFDRAELEHDLVHDFRIDIGDRGSVLAATKKAQPDYVVHMAAQALVRQGYRDPRTTYETNVMGTLNVLDAVNQTDSVKAQLIVTTDKVYLDRGLKRAYRESDPLGGKDPYSASKAMADILSQEYLSRAGAKPGAIARAGNVVGAGDVSLDRLIPDLVRTVETGESLVLRYPGAIRPWQHVLDCLNGYLLALDHALIQNSLTVLNFGPPSGDFETVGRVVELAYSLIGRDPQLLVTPPPSTMPEANTLLLDSSRARRLLGWSESFGLETAISDAVALSSVESTKMVRHHLEAMIASIQTGEGPATR